MTAEEHPPRAAERLAEDAGSKGIDPHDIHTTVIESPTQDTAEDIRVAELIERDADAPALAEAVEQQEAPDAATTLESLPKAERSEVVGQMEFDAASDALAYMQTPLAVSIIEDMLDEDLAYAGDLLAEMAPDDATDILQGLPAHDRERLLASMALGKAHRLRELMTYPRETAGGMMNTQYVAVRDHMSVAEATEVIRRTQVREKMQHAFVLDRKGHLIGIVSLRRLLLAKGADIVRSLCEETVDAVLPEVDREQVAREFQRYRYSELPVVDVERRLLGVVTGDDVLDAVRAEGTEDVQRMVGAGREEAVYSTVGEKLRGRFPWLLVNLFTSSIAAMVVYKFDDLIGKLAFLAVVMPVIANQSGNAGQQSLAVTLRGIVLDHVRPGQAYLLVFREALVGIINGAVCGVVVGTVVAAYGELTGGSWHIGAVVAISMTCTLTIGCFTGSTLPLLVRRMGWDPATASTIFLTMVTDGMSFLVFLGLASLLVRWIGVIPGAS